MTRKVNETAQTPKYSPVFASILKLIAALSLFWGGVVLLFLRIPGWSLILGLPAIQIGIVFLVFTFDEMARGKVGLDSFRTGRCARCGKKTLVLKSQKEALCLDCRQKSGEEMIEEPNLD